MEGELSIRSFEAADQEQARWLILEGLGEHFGSIDETRNPDLDDILHNYIRAGHVFLVGCMGQEIVGTGALIRHSEGTSELVRISTRRDVRRRGIGWAIITALVNVAQLRGDGRIIVKTDASWHEVITFYKCLGFVEYEWTAVGVSLELLATPEVEVET
jgi:GNAT superfamily N-acetyltransferase